MSKSGKGTLEAPGKKVAQKKGLNRSILEQAWFQFEVFLAYKMDERGGTLSYVNPMNTSRACHECGHTSKDNRKSQEKFKCVSCGHTDNADMNAALNIRDKVLV